MTDKCLSLTGHLSHLSYESGDSVEEGAEHMDAPEGSRTEKHFLRGISKLLYKTISQQLKLLALGLHRLGLSTANHGWGGAHEALMDYWQVMDSGIVNAFTCRLKGEPTRLQWMVPNLWPHRWSLLKPVGA